MPNQTREVRPFPKPRQVFSAEGKVLTVPDDWSLLPPGDAALSRRIKQDGPTWTVIEKVGNKRFSRGIWAPTARIEALRAEREIERQDPAYQKKLAAGRARRAEEQAEYVEDFLAEVRRFLAFHPRYEPEERVMAEAIAAHATPVGSGTVARTERIPIEERAEAATIAWMRHQTTGYDHMTIARVKGERREVRRELARQSVRLLERYRSGMDIDPVHCPLQRALKSRRAE
ncbi:MAG TPA: DUF2293 domain-containing protein [Opitutaceae bacterium]|nr:DUF2293 domain-containing protein [Opitutaceae bacterium]